MYILILAI